MPSTSSHERAQLLAVPPLHHPTHYQSTSSPPRLSRPFYHAPYHKLNKPFRTLLIIISFLLAAAALYLYRRLFHRDLVDQLAHSIENLSTCASCKALLIPLISIAHLGDKALYSTLLSFCTGLGIQDSEVCEGALGAQAPVIAHSLRSMSLTGQTATLFCAKTFGLCDDPPVRDWPDMPLPPLRKPANLTMPTRANLSGSTRSHRALHSPSQNSKPATIRKPFQVVHLSDLHIDREYTIGADAKCARNLCCRTNQPTDTPNKTIVPAGPYGNHNCDSPASLYISMLRAIKQHAPDAAFALHTGDMVDHAVWNSVRREVEEGIQQGHSQFLTHSQIPLYGVIGNHDVAPTNSFPRNTTITTLSSQWDIELFSDTWARWIGTQGARTVQSTSGCYSRIHPGTNLRIISLNTGFWYKANFWLYDSDTFQPDPNGILSWLIGELSEAERLGQRAWLIGHLSPGKADCLHEPSRYLNQIMRRFQHTIAASFFGHTHRAEWEIVYEDARQPSAESAVGVIHIGPAMTPESGNPAFRVYDIDPETYEVVDFHEIMTNLSAAGFQSGPSWEHYYSARLTYGQMVSENHLGALAEGAPLDGAFWHRVTAVLERSYPEFEKFYARLTRGARMHAKEEGWKACYTGECRRKWVHNLRSSESEFNEYPNQVGLHLDSVEEQGTRRRKGFELAEDEDGGEHVCGDLASLVKHAKERVAMLRQAQKIKIPKEVKNEIRVKLKNLN